MTMTTTTTTTSHGGNTRIKTRRWREDINPGRWGREKLYFNARALLMYYLSRAHIIIGHTEEMKSLMRIFPRIFFCTLFYLTLFFYSLDHSISLILSTSLYSTRFLCYNILVVIVVVYSRRRLRRNPPPTPYTDAQLRQKKITPVATADVSISGERTRAKCQRWRCSRLAMTTPLQMTMSCVEGSGVDESRQSTLRGLYNIHAAYTQSATTTTILKDLVHRVTEKKSPLPRTLRHRVRIRCLLDSSFFFKKCTRDTQRDT